MSNPLVAHGIARAFMRGQKILVIGQGQPSISTDVRDALTEGREDGLWTFDKHPLVARSHPSGFDYLHSSGWIGFRQYNAFIADDEPGLRGVPRAVVEMRGQSIDFVVADGLDAHQILEVGRVLGPHLTPGNPGLVVRA